jgi:hypothetical protein
VNRLLLRVIAHSPSFCSVAGPISRFGVFTMRRKAVVIRVGQHAQIGQQIFDFGREKNEVPPKFCKEYGSASASFKDARLVITAIEDRVILVFVLFTK